MGLGNVTVYGPQVHKVFRDHAEVDEPDTSLALAVAFADAEDAKVTVSPASVNIQVELIMATEEAAAGASNTITSSSTSVLSDALGVVVESVSAPVISNEMVSASPSTSGLTQGGGAAGGPFLFIAVGAGGAAVVVLFMCMWLYRRDRRLIRRRDVELQDVKKARDDAIALRSTDEPIKAPETPAVPQSHIDEPQPLPPPKASKRNILFTDRSPTMRTMEAQRPVPAALSSLSPVALARDDAPERLTCRTSLNESQLAEAPIVQQLILGTWKRSHIDINGRPHYYHSTNLKGEEIDDDFMTHLFQVEDSANNATRWVLGPAPADESENTSWTTEGSWAYCEVGDELWISWKGIWGSARDASRLEWDDQPLLSFEDDDLSV